ncbi:MAG: rsgA [Clostridia bacterium]|nr:rsgA [Clostridia bacterium]
MINEGLIIKGLGGLYIIKTSEGETECRARGIFRKNKIIPTVGDKVKIEDNTIIEIYPRKNSLVRPAVANIDKLFIVVSFADPEPDVYYIDKIIAIAVHHDIEPIIIFNKTDLFDKAGIYEIYEKLPYKKYMVCASTPDNINNKDSIKLLKDEISGNICALSGFSGVGKSSLLNLLGEIDSAEVGDISKRLQRGKNTTRHVELFSFCGGMIADTPGFSSLSFEYFDIKDRSKLQYCFVEFDEFLSKCRFSDCIHYKEKGCAIHNAVDEGKINKSRYDSYVKMYEEIGEYKEWENKEEDEKK